MSVVIIPTGRIYFMKSYMQIAQYHECKLYLFICMLAGNQLKGTYGRSTYFGSKCYE
jgi:hypothetical protein